MYGLLITTGVILAILYAENLAKKKDLDLEIFWKSLFLIILASLLGARGYYIIDNWYYYVTTPILIPQIWTGGMGIIGAILAGTATLIILFKKMKQPVLKWLDIFALPIPLAQAIGRWGNFFNNEHMPFAIYESFLDIILFLLLLVLEKKHPKDGTIFWVYIIGYILIRFSLQHLR
jgi:phosphatidylglycerol---prolipoprotein diacylglyceryl transferase